MFFFLTHAGLNWITGPQKKGKKKIKVAFNEA